MKRIDAWGLGFLMGLLFLLGVVVITQERVECAVWATGAYYQSGGTVDLGAAEQLCERHELFQRKDTLRVFADPLGPLPTVAP